MNSFRTYILATLFVCCAISVDGQGRVRIAGLENNAEYRALVAREENLARTADSVTRSMDEVRRAFRTDTANRGSLGETILQMEEEMFDIRGRQARVTGQINAIEQEWILKSLGEGNAVVEVAIDSTATSDNAQTVANLVYNDYFERNLSQADFHDLVSAQEKEALIPPLAAEYRENNDRLRLLTAAYDLATVASIADSIKICFDSLVRTNADIDRHIELDWNSVFDNKSYIYNLLMDKNNRTDLLERYTGDLERVRGEEAEWRGRYASDALASYTLQKRLITDYEIMLANEIGATRAADSLKKVQAALPLIGNLALESVTLKERLFLDYADIEAHSPALYNSENPIPEVQVYPRGVIYRVLLGSFLSEQKPSIFRNVAPLAVEKSSDGRYLYFAGGFPSDSTVMAAVKKMRGLGFKKPEPVVWMDGIYVNLATEDRTTGEETDQRFLRVELSGVDELSNEVKEMISTVTGGGDILRAGDVFVVGPLDDALNALRLRTSLDGREDGLEVKVTEISE
jgi:hypothetical protein